MVKRPGQKAPIFINDVRTPEGRANAARLRSGLDANGNVPHGADALTIARHTRAGRTTDAEVEAQRQAVRDLVIKPRQLWHNPDTNEHLIVLAHVEATCDDPEHYVVSISDGDGNVEASAKRSRSTFASLTLLEDDVEAQAKPERNANLAATHSTTVLHLTLLAKQGAQVAEGLAAALLNNLEQPAARGRLLESAGLAAIAGQSFRGIASSVAVSLGMHLRDAVPESDAIILAEIKNAGPAGIPQADMVERMGPVLGSQQPVDEFMRRSALYVALGYIRVEEIGDALCFVAVCAWEG